MNILLTSAGSGRRVRLVKAFIKALKSVNPNGKVIVVDENPYRPGLYLAEKSFLVPLLSSPDFDDGLLEICREEKINWIIPTTDADIYHFAKNRELYEKEGTEIIVSDFKTIKICNNKREFYDYFSKTNIPTPKSFFSLEEMEGNISYPLIIRPLQGYGTKNTYVLKNEKERDFFIGYVNDPFLQEHIAGVEYTIDVLLNLDGKPVSVVPRERKYIRDGVSDVGISVKDQKLIDFALEVTGSLKFIGPINIQCILRNNGKLSLIEINPRFSGGISLTLAAGANFPLWVLKMLKGQNVENYVGKFIPSMTMMVYEETCNRLKNDLLKKKIVETFLVKENENPVSHA